MSQNRRAPWGANIVRQVAGDPYVEGYEATKGESALQAMTKAGLDWDVEMKGVSVSGGKKIDGYRSVVRSDTGKGLSVVRGRYTPIQNREMFEFVDTLVDTSGSSLVSAGSVDGGRRIFSVVKLEGDIRPSNIPDEKIETYLFTSNRHDGLSSFRATVFPLRMVCQNGLRYTRKELVSTFKIRHVRGMTEQIAEAQEALKLASTYTEIFAAEVDELISKTMTEIEFEKMTEHLFPAPAEPEEQKRLDTLQQQRREGLVDVYYDSPNLANIRGTAWGAVNAVAEWEQWVNPAPRFASPEEYQLDLLTRAWQKGNRAFARSVEYARAL